MNMRIFPDPNAFATAAAESFKTLALEAIAARGKFSVALSGGSTPKIVYEALAKIEGVPWNGIHVFWGDDRLVPPDDSRSNYAMAKTALLNHIAIPATNVHRIHGELEGAKAVTLYSAELEKFFGREQSAKGRAQNLGSLSALSSRLSVPFDLVHLGIGPDGHTASLFPGTPNLESPEIVRETFPTPGLEPQVSRVTLSLGVINAARVKQFFVTGASKKPILERVNRGEDVPAAQVQNAEWWLDAAANIAP
jgi:6-phosphogluconolactonase